VTDPVVDAWMSLPGDVDELRNGIDADDIDTFVEVVRPLTRTAADVDDPPADTPARTRPTPRSCAGRG
jgi:hypothetical protein